MLTSFPDSPAFAYDLWPAVLGITKSGYPTFSAMAWPKRCVVGMLQVSFDCWIFHSKHTLWIFCSKHTLRWRSVGWFSCWQEQRKEALVFFCMRGTDIHCTVLSAPTIRNSGQSLASLEGRSDVHGTDCCAWNWLLLVYMFTLYTGLKYLVWLFLTDYLKVCTQDLSMLQVLEYQLTTLI